VIGADALRLHSPSHSSSSVEVLPPFQTLRDWPSWTEPTGQQMEVDHGHNHGDGDGDEGQFGDWNGDGDGHGDEGAGEGAEGAVPAAEGEGERIRPEAEQPRGRIATAPVQAAEDGARCAVGGRM